MRFWTRKNERQAVAALLEDDSFESSDSMADAILKAAFEAFLERDWWLTILGDPRGPAFWGYGLAASEAEAKKLALVQPARVVPISSAAAKLRELEAS